MTYRTQDLESQNEQLKAQLEQMEKQVAKMKEKTKSKIQFPKYPVRVWLSLAFLTTLVIVPNIVSVWFLMCGMQNGVLFGLTGMMDLIGLIAGTFLSAGTLVTHFSK